MPKKLRWLRSPTGSNGRPWNNWRLSRNRIRCWPGTESSSPTSSTDRSFANPGVVRELTRKPSGWWCGWRRKIPGGADRIVGAMANLGHRLSDQTVGNILRRHDIPPAPKRKQTTSCKNNVLLFPLPTQAVRGEQEKVRCRERLGGLLKYYEREAA